MEPRIGRMRFEKTVDGMELLAAYVAQLTKSGVVFRVEQFTDETVVELTGGF